METKDFMSENQRILEKWQQAFEKAGGSANKFSWDGIMFKGAIYEEDGTNNWLHKEGGNENQLWANAPLRILYLTKDQNTKGGPCWDTREESYYKTNSELETQTLDTQYKFNKMLVYTLYGLAKTTPDQMMKYDFSNPEALEFIDKFPFARINCKKEGGQDTCPNNILSAAMSKYEMYLEEQIKNIDADIFVCCGYSESSQGNIILNFLNEHGYNFEGPNKNASIFYDRKQNKIAINSYHLSYRSYSDEDMYDDIVSTYYEFLKKYPDFYKSHRK